MDPHSVISTLKDVYLVSRFIFRTVEGMQKRDGDLLDLQDKFSHEMALLRSNAQAYLQNEDGTVDVKVFQDEWCQKWLEDYKKIMDKLQMHVSKYQELAAEQDVSYQAHRSLKAPESEQLKIGFVWELDNEAVEVEALPEPKKSFKEAVSDKMRALKFSLFQKKDLEQLLENIKDERKRIDELVPTIERTHPRLRDGLLKPGQVQQLRSLFIDATTTVIAQHRQMQQISRGGSEMLLITAPLEVAGSISDTESIHSARMVKAQDLLLQPDREIGKVEPKEGSGLKTGRLSNPSKKVLIEYKGYARIPSSSRADSPQPENSEDRKGGILGSDEIERLVMLLASSTDPSFLTLPFHSYRDQPNALEGSRYAFIFDYPPNCNQKIPTSLFKLLSPSEMHGPIELKQRFQLATKLATTLASLHEDGWVHKSIRSENIVFFEFENPEPETSSPFLVGFEYSRPVAGFTMMDRDTGVGNNLYRHPLRQNTPQIGFTRTHDIYALGVVLLEIGTWKTAWQIYKDRKGIEPTRTNVDEAQGIFQKAAKDELPKMMGQVYADAVTICLSDGFEKKETMTNFGALFKEKVARNLSAERLVD